jgi:hypothetical protein
MSWFFLKTKVDFLKKHGLLFYETVFSHDIFVGSCFAPSKCPLYLGSAAGPHVLSLAERMLSVVC